MGQIIEEQCFGEGRDVYGGKPIATVTLVCDDGAKITDAWMMDRQQPEWLVNQGRLVWVRMLSVKRFMVHPNQ
jgi:hypothetical protein